jgi:eukaryotic-like serine/threonine-protein kinase
MALTSGTKLGPYEIVAPIGAGGMGEVYRACDTRLDRTVAIKILPANLSSNLEARQRFEREGRAISSLNHPNICTLYDIGHQDGTDYLVMEFLEGQTLADRLLKGPLPPGQVLKYGIEICEGLEKAHRGGVTHRDLKPGNVMLTKTGAKLMDFGLAKAGSPSGASASSLTLTSPVASRPLTQEGMIVGTFQYMSPEQIEGKEADARSDIFALGAVLYEMATGKRAFEGKSTTSVIAAILERNPPPISAVQPMFPQVLDRVLATCLAKDPDERFQTVHDLKVQLKWIAEGSSQFPSQPPAELKGSHAFGRQGLILSVGTLLLGAVIASLATWNLKPVPPPPISRFTITLPSGQQLAGLEDGSAVALSLDGTHLAYAARQGQIQQLYFRAMDRLEARPIPGTEGASEPLFSPDGQWLVFFASGKLKKVSVNGGGALTLGDAFQPRGASLGSQGTVAFAASWASTIQQVPDVGGTPQALTHFAKGENSHRWPEFLPGGKAVLFSAAMTSSTWVNPLIAVHSVATGERRNLVQLGTQPRYALSGHLLYAQAGTLMAAPFDPQRLELTGAAVPVVEGVLQSGISGAVQYSLSATGSLVYVPGNIQADQRKLVWVTRNGAEQPIAAPARAYRIPRLSPDGRRVIVAIDDEGAQTWLYDFSRETLIRLTFGGTVNQAPVWSPDGKRLVFQSNREGSLSLFSQLADGSGGLERLTTSESSPAANSWSSDGQLLAFVDVDPTSGWAIWVLRLSDRKAQPFLQAAFNGNAPRFSPDGHWLAYASDETGHFEVYVQPYPGPGGKWQISADGGMEPMWNPNGRELFYRSGRKMMAVEIATQPGFTAGKPRVLFEGDYVPTPLQFPNYDVSPDGQRFLMLKPSEQEAAAPTQINVVLNWFEELKQRVPPAKK